MFAHQTRQGRRSLHPHSILRAVGGALLAGIVAGCVAPAGSSSSSEAQGSPDVSGSPALPSAAAEDEAPSASPSPAPGSPDAHLAAMTWVATDPDSGAWILGVGADAGWQPDLGDRGRVTTNWGRFATVSTKGQSDPGIGTHPRVGIADPDTRSIVEMVAPFGGNTITPRVDPTGRWLFVTAGSQGADAGIVALDPRSAETRVIVPPAKVQGDYERYLLLWSPTGKTLVSTLCNFQSCFVDLIDAGSMTSSRLDQQFAPLAVTDRYLIGRQSADRAWAALDLATGKISELAVEPSAQVGTLVPIDDSHVALDLYANGTYSIVVVDLVTGDQRTIHQVELDGDDDPAIVLMKVPPVDPAHLVVSASSTFADLLGDHRSAPTVQLLDVGTGDLAGSPLTLSIAP